MSAPEPGPDRRGGPTWTRREITALLLAGGLVSACESTTGRAPSRPGAVRRQEPDETRALPAPRTSGGASLVQTLRARRSVRDFTVRALTADQLGQLLWAAQGVTRPWGGRTAPSAGALYPLELYTVAEAELGHYLPKGHRLEVWRAGRDLRGRLAAAAHGQDAVAAAPAVVVVTGVMARSAAKYGDRAQRYVDLEAGHATQSLLLQAVALGLAAVPMGAFDDAAVSGLLGLPDGHAPRYLVPVGHPAPGA